MQDIYRYISFFYTHWKTATTRYFANYKAKRIWIKILEYNEPEICIYMIDVLLNLGFW